MNNASLLTSLKSIQQQLNALFFTPANAKVYENLQRFANGSITKATLNEQFSALENTDFFSFEKFETFKQTIDKLLEEMSQTSLKSESSANPRLSESINSTLRDCLKQIQSQLENIATAKVRVEERLAAPNAENIEHLLAEDQARLIDMLLKLPQIAEQLKFSLTEKSLRLKVKTSVNLTSKLNKIINTLYLAKRKLVGGELPGKNQLLFEQLLKTADELWLKLKNKSQSDEFDRLNKLIRINILKAIGKESQRYENDFAKTYQYLEIAAKLSETLDLAGAENRVTCEVLLERLRDAEAFKEKVIGLLKTYPNLNQCIAAIYYVTPVWEKTMEASEFYKIYEGIHSPTKSKGNIAIEGNITSKDNIIEEKNLEQTWFCPKKSASQEKRLDLHFEGDSAEFANFKASLSPELKEFIESYVNNDGFAYGMFHVMSYCLAKMNYFIMSLPHAADASTGLVPPGEIKYINFSKKDGRLICQVHHEVYKLTIDKGGTYTSLADDCRILLSFDCYFDIQKVDEATTTAVKLPEHHCAVEVKLTSCKITSYHQSLPETILEPTAPSVSEPVTAPKPASGKKPLKILAGFLLGLTVACLMTALVIFVPGIGAALGIASMSLLAKGLILGGVMIGNGLVGAGVSALINRSKQSQIPQAQENGMPNSGPRFDNEQMKKGQNFIYQTGNNCQRQSPPPLVDAPKRPAGTSASSAVSPTQVNSKKPTPPDANSSSSLSM